MSTEFLTAENESPKRGPGAPKSNKNARKHGLSTMKKALKELGSSGIDKRTALGKALNAWRSELVADLGGTDALSAMQHSVLDTLIKTKVILDSVDGYILRQGWIANMRKRAVWPIVRERQAIADSLVRQLQILGLERKAREVPSLRAYLEEKARQAPTSHDQRTGESRP